MTPTYGIITITCLWLSAKISKAGANQYYPDFINPAFNPQYNPENPNQNPTRTDPVIFERCWVESTIPMQVALGDLNQWTYMCSPSYFSTCKTSLPVALLEYGLDPYQRDYIMSVLNAWVEGGATYLCNTGQGPILQLMQNGGYSCLRGTARQRIERCNLQLASLGTGTEYSEAYCNTWDNDLRCYIDAVNTCPDDDLANFLWDFFENVMYSSPCRDISIFVNDAQNLHINQKLIITMLILPLIITILAS